MERNSTEQIMKRVAITGASGFVGRQLATRLAGNGVELTLLGRDPSSLRVLFPDTRVLGYSDMGTAFSDVDVVVHLATLNTGSAGSLEQFHSINRDFLVEAVEAARAAGVRNFINVSSIHALRTDLTSNYALSKREGAEALKAYGWDRAVTLYLPSVHGDVWSGRWSILNRLPRPIAEGLFKMASACFPTVHVDKLARFIETVEPPHSEASVVLSDNKSENLFYTVTKRVVDITVAIAVVVLLWWLMALIWVAIRLSSKGPGVFAQPRVGRDQNVFVCYKFRTMKEGVRQAGTHEISAAAVTPMGRILRSTKLDELPQVINILRNEMSLVGPRPCMPNQTELVEERSARGVFNVKPGITGLAQINDIDMKHPGRLAVWDERYIQLRGLLPEFKILLATALGGGRGDRVA